MPKYYTHDKMWNNYRILKTTNRKRISYGTYKTEKEAAQVVEKLKECNWDKTQLPQILKELNIKSKIK